MHRSTLRSLLFAAASAAVALLPQTSASAQPLSGPLLRPEQVRADYLAQGFQTSGLHTWWTNGSTSFTVEDPTEQHSPSARTLMVIVYPDLATAEHERRDGARLVPGYGPSVWQRNVALVQTTRAELARRHTLEVNSSDPTCVDPDTEPQIVAAEANDAVALDFLAVVQPSLTADL